MRPPRSVIVALSLSLAVVLMAEIGLAALTSRGAVEPRENGALDAPGRDAGIDKPLGRLPLLDERGRRTSLAAYRGRYVVLAPSLTLCHEVCPLTTGALMELRRELDRRGLARRAVIAQVTVDPWRDSPERIRAFQRLTGSRVPFLTGTRGEIQRLWRTLGVTVKRVPQAHPADIDWWTGKPERFDVAHSDGAFVIDPRGHLRAAFAGMPALDGRLPPRLAGLLNDEGRANLRRPQAPWTVAEVLAAVENLAGAARRPSGAGRVLGGGPGAVQAQLRALRGRTVVVNEWASWCLPCRREMPLLAAAAERYRGRVAFLGLNVRDTGSAARRLLAQHPLGYPSYADPDGRAAAALAKSVGLPTTVFLDPAGRIAGVHMGQYTDAGALARDIARHLPGRVTSSP